MLNETRLFAILTYPLGCTGLGYYYYGNHGYIDTLENYFLTDSQLTVGTMCQLVLCLGPESALTEYLSPVILFSHRFGLAVRR